MKHQHAYISKIWMFLDYNRAAQHAVVLYQELWKQGDPRQVEALRRWRAVVDVWEDYLDIWQPEVIRAARRARAIFIKFAEVTPIIWGGNLASQNQYLKLDDIATWLEDEEMMAEHARRLLVYRDARARRQLSLFSAYDQSPLEVRRLTHLFSAIPIPRVGAGDGRAGDGGAGDGGTADGRAADKS